jgi:hypothetical protein
MARQKFISMHRLSCKAFCPRHYFAPKTAWITDDLHPSGVWADVSPAPHCTYTRATWPPRGRGRGESLTSPRRIEARVRAGDVMHLRMTGHTWQYIADACGFKDASGPWRAVRRAQDRIDYERYSKQQIKKYS